MNVRALIRQLEAMPDESDVVVIVSYVGQTTVIPEHVDLADDPREPGGGDVMLSEEPIA